MKTLLLLFVLALSFAPLQAENQSLAEKHNEPRSLYNAICKENGIVPGEIGMTEFRKLAKEYAITVGLTYTLYKFNGEQNLEILHAKPTTNEITRQTKKETRQVQTNRGNTQIHDSNEHNSVDTTSSNSIIATNIGRISSEILVGKRNNDIRIDTVTISIISERIDTFYVAVIVPIDTHEPFCDCQDKSIEELNMYYTTTLKNRRNAEDPELKDRYGFCAYQIRRYKKHLERQERIHQRSREPDTKEVSMTKKKRTRKLGKGHAKSPNNSLWSMIFPFRNC